MLYFGRQLTAAEAKEYGLVSQVFPQSQLDKAWDEIYRLAKLPPQVGLKHQKNQNPLIAY